MSNNNTNISKQIVNSYGISTTIYKNPNDNLHKISQYEYDFVMLLYYFQLAIQSKITAKCFSFHALTYLQTGNI